MSTVTYEEIGTELLSPESVELLNQVRNYLSETVIAVTVSDESEAEAATSLANELQKKKTELDNQRKTEKSIWDEKAKTVQGKFKPIIDEIINKKTVLTEAVGKYRYDQQQKAIEEQRKLDAEADREMEKLKGVAATAKDKALALLNQANDIIDKATGMPDGKEKDNLIRQSTRMRQRAEEWIAKANAKEQQAKMVVPTIAPSAAPAKFKGGRTSKECEIKIVDLNRFASWCAATGQALAFLSINESAIKASQKQADGKVEMPGLRIRVYDKFGVSGR